MRLVVIGDLNLDVAAPSPHPEILGGEARSAIRAEIGGSAATFARWAAKLGADVVFLGCVGKDAVGELLVQSLVEDGVEACVTRDSRPSGVVIALWEGEERTMICSRGANDGLDGTAIVESVFRGANHVHLSGYTFLSSAQRPAARRAIRLGRRMGCTVSVDPPPATLIRSSGVGRFESDLQGVDWILPNLEEGRLLAGVSRPQAIVDALASRFAAGALTLGEGGAVAWRGGERSTRPCPGIVRIDPTGAGDAYAAAFVVALLRGASVDESNRTAVATSRAYLMARAAAWA